MKSILTVMAIALAAMICVVGVGAQILLPSDADNSSADPDPCPSYRVRVICTVANVSPIDGAYEQFESDPNEPADRVVIRITQRIVTTALCTPGQPYSIDLTSPRIRE